MSKESYVIGKEGESLAEKYLVAKGYQIIEKNFRSRRGEVDIVAHEKEILAFVEVKNYAFDSYASPLDAITPYKKTCLIHAAKTWLLKTSRFDSACRFDVLIIFYSNQNARRFLLIKNAFEVT